MKQQIKWLIAALALTALATPAFAVTADMTGSLSVRAFATNNMDGENNANDHTRFVDQRFRLFTTAAANENVKLVLGLEVDNVWGRTSAPSPANGTAPVAAPAKEVGSLGTDAKGQIEIKHLYLDFNIPTLNANVKAGSQAFNLGRGLIINDDAAGVQATIAVAGNPLSLYWIKPYEGGAVSNNDEVDFYAVKYALKAGDTTIAPYVGYTLYGKNTQAFTKDANPSTNGTYGVIGDGATSLYVGVDIDGKADALGYGLTAIYNSWDADGRGEGDSIALIAKADYTAGDTKFLAEVARYGDKDNAGEFAALKDLNVAATGPSNNFSEILTGGMYTTNTNSVNVGGAAATYSVNYMYLKVGAVQTISPDAKVSAYIMHIEQAEDTDAADAITYGQEVDAYFDYTIVPGLGLNVAGAYLIADNDFGDDAWKLASSLNYKF